MVEELLAQLRANARLRWGLALIVAIGWFYGVLELRDDVQHQARQFDSAAQAVARLNGQLAQPEWVERAKAARALAVQLEGRLWQAPTSGLAQSALQDWLLGTAVKVGLAPPQISVALVEDAVSGAAAVNAPAVAPASAESTTPPNLWKLRAKLGFDFNAPALLDLLARMENNDKQLVIKQLTIRKEPAPRVELEVLAYFQKPAKAATSANPP